MDKRIVNTHRKLKEALFKLMEDKPCSKISVKTLCETANVNRSTFYAYYKSSEDLLDNCLMELKKQYFEAATFDTPEQGMKDVFNITKQNATMLTVILKLPIFISYVNELCGYFKEKCCLYWVRKYNISYASAETAFSFISGGIIQVCEDWIASGCSENIENLSVKLVKLCDGAAALK